MPDELSGIRLRTLFPNDLEKLKGITPITWNNPVEQTIASLAGEPKFLPVVAEIGKELAGVGHVIRFGDSSWLGNIIVRESFRNRGIGLLLTRHLTNLCQAGQPVMLVATDLGFRIYEKLGFNTSGYYSFFRCGEISDDGQLTVVPATAGDTRQILDLDRIATGETRDWLLKRSLAEAQIIRHRDSGLLRGFYLPRFGAGLIVAADPEAGKDLLRYKLHHYPGQQLCIPSENTIAINFLEQLPAVKYLEAPRMFLHRDTAWHPGMVFSRGTGYCG